MTDWFLTHPWVLWAVTAAVLFVIELVRGAETLRRIVNENLDEETP